MYENFVKGVIMNNIVKKNEKYVVEILDNGFEGEGITKIDGFTVFVQGAIKGEKVEILVLKVLTSYAFAKIIKVIEKSPYRIDVDCNTYKRCGGCNLRHIDYKYTLEIKRNAVQSLVSKTLKNDVKVLDTLGMIDPYFYRNKVQYPVGFDKEGKPCFGIFANRTHDIVQIDKCYIQSEKSQEIAKYVFQLWIENDLSIYNEKTRKGLLRHIVIKNGFKTGEFMCVLVINGTNFDNKAKIINSIINKFSVIKTIVLNINTDNTNVIMGKNNVILYGDGIIEDILGDYRFKISPLSFYQVNPIQAEKLYNIAVDYANISKEDIVFDLYCGIGTISLFMSKFAKKIYGIEIVEEAVKAAKENAELNDVRNADFIAGDVELVLDNLINNKGIIPNVVMVDPPRKGLDNNSIQNLLKVKANKIIYISCNPATLVRDLAKLENAYDIVNIKPVDMFPYTSHVECCAMLELKNYQ